MSSGQTVPSCNERSNQATADEGARDSPAMSNTRKVLVLAPRFPLPLTSGTQIREYHVLKALSERFDVTLVSLVQDGEGSEYVDDIEELAEVHTVAHSRSKLEAIIRFTLSRMPYRVCKFTTPSFRRQVHEQLDEASFDLVWANFLNTVAAVPEDIPCPVILDEHNSDVRYWESFLDGSLPERTIARLNIRRLRRLRRTLTDRFTGVVSVSEADATEARDWAGNPVWTMPNGVDTEKFAPTTSAADTDESVVFVGSLDVRMNEEAVEWFVETAWPRIRTDHPNATFVVVGRNPTEKVREVTNAPGVKLVGEVSSVVPYYDRAAVTVAPFQFGGGTKLKVLEALAMARPLVTTAVGATGIPVSDGEDALIRERDESFAEAVAELLNAPEKRADLGGCARSFIEQEFAWDAITAGGLDQVVADVFR